MQREFKGVRKREESEEGKEREREREEEMTRYEVNGCFFCVKYM